MLPVWTATKPLMGLVTQFCWRKNKYSGNITNIFKHGTFGKVPKVELVTSSIKLLQWDLFVSRTPVNNVLSSRWISLQKTEWELKEPT